MSTLVASSSCLSPNVSLQPSAILAELDCILAKLGKDMMSTLVKIACVWVQVKELCKAEEGESGSLGTCNG